MLLACLLWDAAKLLIWVSSRLDHLGDRTANRFVERHVRD